MPVIYAYSGASSTLKMGVRPSCCRWQRILNSTLPFILLVPAYCVRLSVPMLCSFALGPQPTSLHAPQQSILAVCCQIDVGWHAGAEWSILNPPSSWPQEVRSQLYGKNDMSAGKPSACSMAAEILTHPIYGVQVSTCPL